MKKIEADLNRCAIVRKDGVESGRKNVNLTTGRTALSSFFHEGCRDASH